MFSTKEKWHNYEGILLGGFMIWRLGKVTGFISKLLNSDSEIW